MKKVRSAVVISLVILVLMGPVLAYCEHAIDDLAVTVVSPSCPASGIQLTWTPHTDFTEYHVYGDKIGDGKGPFGVGTVASGSIDDTVGPGTYKFWLVCDEAASGFACLTNEVSLTIPPCDTAVPEFPSLFVPLVSVIGIIGTVLLIRGIRKS